MEYGKPTEYEGKSFAPNVGAKHIDYSTNVAYFVKTWDIAVVLQGCCTP